ncbi:MAG: cell division ATP-binding protein FtsE [Gammaproteobacteria bacterium]|nr:cell division ATP-binding protein FtsE [Gammaproteobacteria bacterium]
MIRFENVSKRYDGGREALSSVSIEVAAGELAFLTGRSGAGKSTVLKLVALIERPTRGQVTVGGRQLGKLSYREIPAYRQQIGMVFQDNRLLNDRSAYENVALPLIISGTGQREIGRRVRAALDQVGLLDREKYPPTALSAGEQQRLAIARAVVSRPAVLIADEPTGNLDPELSLEIMTLFRRLNEVGVTMLIASHDLPLVERFGSRRIVLSGGQVSSGETIDRPAGAAR